MSDLKWKGYAICDTNKWDEFKLIDFKPKTPGDYDIDVKIEYCGICGSDVHVISGGWGEPALPLIPGHEIVGHVVRVGPKVTEFKVGDRAGVGAQVYSCLKCERCLSDNEQYCHNLVHTYGDKYPNGEVTQGGYSTAVRAHERYVFRIPTQLSLEQAAPMLCGGLTVYSGLVRHGGGSPGKKIGVVGVGGLGHYAIQFARALGASQVVTFSHSAEKEADAKELGTTDFVNTTLPDFAKDWAGKLDLILCTTDVTKNMPLREYLSMLRVNCQCIMLAMPDEPLPKLNSFDFSPNGALLGGSHIGNKKEAIEMLDVAVKKGVKSIIEILPMKECGKAVRDVKHGQVRYRHVLKNDIE